MDAAFPMARSGGLFIAIMGLGVASGSMLPAWRKPMLLIGAAAATLALVLFGPRLSLGPPTRTQIGYLIGAIVLEAVLVRVAVGRYKNAGEQRLMLAILFVVGLHFLPMAGAFGSVCIALSVACMANAAIGLWLRHSWPFNTLWLTDGIIKMMIGAVMMLR